MKHLILHTLLLISFCGAYAQVTTSSMTGRVEDAESNPMIGAAVVAVHTPSGTQYGVATDSNGQYNITGMRVGGPYTLTVSYLGYHQARVENIELLLGDTERVDVELRAQALDIDRVVVVADDTSIRGHGTGERFRSERIASMPTITRSIYDITRLSPQMVSPKAGGVSVAGASTRYNSFRIDGMASDDVYGLGTTGMTGSLTQANPIPLDAIEQLRVAVAPFDVRESGFTGGGINAVTKAGDNSLRGSAYFYYNDENFYGTTAGSGVAERTKLSEQTTQIYGLSLSGPIVRDKLFFFVNGEYNRNVVPSTYHPSASGSAVTAEQAAAIGAHYSSLTGWDGGGYAAHDVPALSGALIARLDWNIDSTHRMSLRYNMLHADKNDSSNSSQYFYFTGSEYTNINRTHSIVAELNSTFSAWSNSLRAGYTYLRDGRETDRQLPAVIINGTGAAGNGTTVIGTNQYAGRNMLTQHILILTDNASLHRGDHTITVGTHNEFYSADNLYLSNAMGTYTYASIDDFLADDGTTGGHASQYVYEYFTDRSGASARLNSAQFSLYAQDEWRRGGLTLTYGLRLDMPVFFDSPHRNEAFNTGRFAQKYGVRVGDVPRTQLLFSPRVGATWRHEGLTLRGGAGIFTGRVPFVWINNCYQNTGMTKVGVTVNDRVSTPAFSTTPSAAGVKGNPSIDVVDDAFRFPQVLRANLAAEYDLRGWKLLVEGLYSKGINNVVFRNLSAEDSGRRLYMADAASPSATYYTSDTSDYSAVYRLSNTGKGHSWSVTGRIERNFPFGLGFMAAYTYSQSRSVNDGISAQSSSNWGRTYTVDSNSPELSYSVYDFPHKAVAMISYTRRYGLMGTTVTLVYDGHSGERYSLTYARGRVDENGDTYRGNTLMYIPARDEMDRTLWADDSSKQAFDDYIESDPYLRSHRGSFAERNSHSLPFEHRVDLHLAQDFYFGRNTSRRVQLSLDILNVGNLLCRSWGTTWRTSNWTLSPVTVTGLEAVEGGFRPVYKFTGASATRDDILSRWHMQLGVRVVF